MHLLVFYSLYETEWSKLQNSGTLIEGGGGGM
jgi:hypothetical protein